MKNLLKAIACAVVITTCYNCSVESAEIVQEEYQFLQEEMANIQAPEVLCTAQDPEAALTNNSLLSANIEVFDQFGLLMTHAYGVPSGSVSPTLSFPDGMTTFVISTSITSKEVKIDMGNCMIYEVIINQDNHLNTDVPNQL